MDTWQRLYRDIQLNLYLMLFFCNVKFIVKVVQSYMIYCCLALSLSSKALIFSFKGNEYSSAVCLTRRVMASSIAGWRLGCGDVDWGIDALSFVLIVLLVVNGSVRKAMNVWWFLCWNRMSWHVHISHTHTRIRKLTARPLQSSWRHYPTFQGNCRPTRCPSIAR